MDPSSNFASYRSTLTAAIARSEVILRTLKNVLWPLTFSFCLHDQVATDDRARSVVPFLSLFKKDLFVAREKYLNSLEDR